MALVAVETAFQKEMEPNMNRSQKRWTAALLGAGISLASVMAIAHPMDCGPGRDGDGPRGRFAEFHKKHQQQLHDALKLTPQQEAAWNKFQESSPFAQRPNGPSPEELAKLPAPERAEKMLERQKLHQEAASKHLAALKEFYAQLSPEQKKTFDEQSFPGKHGHRRDRGPEPRGGERQPAPPPPPAAPR